MNKNILFFLKVSKLKLDTLFKFKADFLEKPIVFKRKFLSSKKNTLSKKFFKKLVNLFRPKKISINLKKKFFFFFINKFLLNFIEFLFKSSILFNLKKGSNKILLKQMSFRKFSFKYFKKWLKTSKQIIGILYYSFLLKDASMFTNFFKKIFEKLDIKMHKKLIRGLKKLIKDLFRPVFNFLGVIGVFFNLKGKIGVSGSAKKRRSYFYLGKHSITTRDFKMDLKFLPVWTFTGSMGFSFYIFF